MSLQHFRTWHALLSCVLLRASDEVLTAAAAEHEWALAGGKDELTFESFNDWQFDVLEVWAAQPDEAGYPVHPDQSGIIMLAEELLETVCASARHCLLSGSPLRPGLSDRTKPSHRR